MGQERRDFLLKARIDWQLLSIVPKPVKVTIAKPRYGEEDRSGGTNKTPQGKCGA